MAHAIRARRASRPEGAQLSTIDAAICVAGCGWARLCACRVRGAGSAAAVSPRPGGSFHMETGVAAPSVGLWGTGCDFGLGDMGCCAERVAEISSFHVETQGVALHAPMPNQPRRP